MVLTAQLFSLFAFFNYLIFLSIWLFCHYLRLIECYSSNGYSSVIRVSLFPLLYSVTRVTLFMLFYSKFRVTLFASWLQLCQQHKQKPKQQLLIFQINHMIINAKMPKRQKQVLSIHCWKHHTLILCLPVRF